MNFISVVERAQAATADTLVANFAVHIINPLITLLFAIAIAAFLWGVVEFIAGADDESKVSQGKQHMLWGIIGIAIMVSAFGIMNVLCNTINC